MTYPIHLLLLPPLGAITPSSNAAAAELLLSGDDLRDPSLASAFYLLVCFGIELLFKAVALRDGASEQDLRGIGHDLHKAYLRAMRSGNVPHFMTPLGRFVLELREQHKTRVFRYTPDVPQIEVPLPRPTWKF